MRLNFGHWIISKHGDAFKRIRKLYYNSLFKMVDIMEVCRFESPRSVQKCT